MNGSSGMEYRLTYFSVVTDPVYLARPMSKSFVLQRSVKDPTGWLYACDDADQILTRNDENVPQFLYGQIRTFASTHKYKIPLIGALGGPETMYPEFIAKMKAAADAEAMAKTLPAPGAPKAAVVPDPTPNDAEIHTLQVRDNIYLLTGDGANIAVQIGPQGALVVDTGAGKLADKVVAAVKKLTDLPIQFVVNTSFYPDHTGGNVKVHLAGADLTLFGGNFGGGACREPQRLSPTRMFRRVWTAPRPRAGRRTPTCRAEGESISTRKASTCSTCPTRSQTETASFIFRKSDVIVTGDIFMTTRYPFFDVKNGGSLKGELQALNYILGKTVYEHDEDGGTLIIPGHGYITNEFEVSEYRNMLVIVRDRIQAMINKGATLEQSKRPE